MKKLFFLLAALALAALQARAEDEATCRAPGVTPPKPANQHAAVDYPPLSVVLREQGTTRLGFVIKEDGTPTAVTVLQSSGSLRLDDASVAAVTQNWRYVPARAPDGRPLACPWKAEVKWTLDEASSPLPEELARIAVPARPGDWPPDARRKGEQGSTALMVILIPGMAETFVAVMESSGYADLDQAALKLVKDRLKLPTAELDGRPVPTMAMAVVLWQADPPAKSPEGQ